MVSAKCCVLRCGKCLSALADGCVFHNLSFGKNSLEELPSKSITLTFLPQWYYFAFSLYDKILMCLFLFPCQTIKHLRTSEFKPFVVFVKPPVIERLRETRQNAKFMSGKDDKESARPFKVREHLSGNSFSI